MSELTLPTRYEAAPEASSRVARMLGKAASFLNRAAARADERAAKRSHEPVHAVSPIAPVEDGGVTDTVVVDPLERTAGYDLTSDDAREAIESIVGRLADADQRSAQGLPREENSRAARRARQDAAYAARENALLGVDVEPIIDDPADQAELLSTAIPTSRKARRAERKAQRAEQKAQREAAYALRESSLLGIEEGLGASVGDAQTTAVEPEVTEAPEQPVYRGRHARTPEVSEQLEMFSWIDDKDDALAAPRHAGARNDEGDLEEGLDFSWMEERSPGEEAALAEAEAEAEAESTPKRTIRERIAALKNPGDAALYWAARAQSGFNEWVLGRQMASMAEQQRQPDRRRRVGLVLGSVAAVAVVSGVSAWLRSNGNDTSPIDGAAFELQPIMPIDGGTEAVEPLSQLAPLDTTPAGDIASQTTEASSAASGGSSGAGGAGGSAETVGALSGEVIDPSAWIVPKGSGGEQLAQRLGADKSVWYEHQNAFLKRFPSEAYRMNDGNVGLRPGRLSQGAIDFWTKAISK